MSEVVDKIKSIVLDKCAQHKKNVAFGCYDYWNDHIKRVVHPLLIIQGKELSG